MHYQFLGRADNYACVQSRSGSLVHDSSSLHLGFNNVIPNKELLVSDRTKEATFAPNFSSYPRSLPEQRLGIRKRIHETNDEPQTFVK